MKRTNADAGNREARGGDLLSAGYICDQQGDKTESEQKMKPNGGTAFPNYPYDGLMVDPDGSGKVGRGSISGTAGMTLRDYFAAAALHGLMAAPWHPQMGIDWRMTPKDTAPVAYEYADAMIAERDK